MIEIPLRNRDGDLVGTALIDAADAHLAEHRWSLSNHGYAKRTARRDGRACRVYLHREVAACSHGDSVQVEHLSGDKLDNRRANLRRVTYQQNGQNVAAGHGSSRFRGVGWHAVAAKWQARAVLAGRAYYLGLYSSEVVAAAVAAQWRADHMPFSCEAAA